MFLFLKCYHLNLGSQYFLKYYLWIIYKGWIRFEEHSTPFPLPFLAGSMILGKCLISVIVSFLIYKEKLVWFDFCNSN